MSDETDTAGLADTGEEDDPFLAAVAATPRASLDAWTRLRAGAMFGERYRLEQPIGEGGMGMVWAASDTKEKRKVALKFLKHSDASEDARRRFRREARAASAVDHPNVVHIHDLFELDDGAPVMVMELLEGESLAERIARSGALPLGPASSIILSIVSAVGTAHAAGIVHRDLKPQNVFICSDGTVKVLDFGIAKLTRYDESTATSTGLTGTGAIMGTPCHMAPEQAFGERDIDHRADIWAIGLMLYECLSGVLPTRGDNVGQVIKVIVEGGIGPIERHAPGLPEDLCALVARMLRRHRHERPSDLREVAEVLGRHTSSVAPAFGAVTVAPERSPSGVATVADVAPPSSARPAETAPSGAHPVSLARKADALAEAKASPQRARGAIVAGVLVAAGAGLWFGTRDETPADPPSAASGDSQPAAPPPPHVEPDPSPGATATLPAPATTSSTKAPAPSSARVASARPAAPASASAPAPVDPPPAASSARLPGGVVGKPPF